MCANYLKPGLCPAFYMHYNGFDQNEVGKVNV